MSKTIEQYIPLPDLILLIKKWYKSEKQSKPIEKWEELFRKPFDIYKLHGNSDILVIVYKDISYWLYDKNPALDKFYPNLWSMNGDIDLDNRIEAYKGLGRVNPLYSILD